MATDTIHAATLAQSRFRALIADDQHSAREINQVLERDGSIDIVSQCASGTEAIAAIAQHEPDMVFVDVQLPEIPGFQVVEAGTRVPAVVFLSSLDRYAARAFEAQAADYVLKPFRPERLLQAVERAKLRVQMERNRSLFGMLPEPNNSDGSSGTLPERLERIVLREDGRTFFKRVRDIACFTSAANYVNVHCGEQIHRVRSTMNELERKLDPKQFLRIHRCTIVNLEFLRDFRPLPHGDYLVRLVDGKELTMSRNYRQQFRNAVAAMEYKH
jgi:two-component system LytT family response regulator